MTKKLMTKDEWYHCPEHIKLRLLNNMASKIQYCIQEFNDVLELVLAENEELCVFDAFSLTQSQARIVSLEGAKLWGSARKLAERLEPHNYKDVCKRCNNPWKDGKCPTCDRKQPDDS
jgi:rubrerythrin